MSLQVQSSQQPTSGRRTPQIYQNLTTSGNAAPSPPTTTTTTTSSAKGSASKLSLKAATSGKQSPVVDLTEQAVAAVVVAKESPKSPNLVVSVTKLDKTPSSGSPKVAEKEEKATNGSSNGNHSEKETNGKHKEPVAVAETVKAKPETPKREEEKKAKETPKREEEKEKKVKESPKASPRSTPQKQQQPESIPVEQVKTPESAGKKTKETLVAVTPEQKKKPEKVAAVVENPKTEGDEMESLVVEPSEYEDSPMPPRTGGKTKLLKYSGAPPTRARISPFRVHAEAAAVTNASTIVNLSTVSEGQSSTTDSAEPSPAIDIKRPLRAISGRRATRPITDIQFTYRKSAELNDSVSSLNVTVGSEIHNDSLRTPAPGSTRKRKAMTPESTSDALDVKETFDSPKRGRLDLSGFLGMVASPVTMLKNRFSRVRLHASTPVAKRSMDEEDLTKCVQAEATTTTANISGEGAAKMDVDPAADEEVKKVEQVEKIEGAESETTLKEGQTEVPEGTTTTTAEESKADEGSGDGAEPVEVKDVTNKSRCVVM